MQRLNHSHNHYDYGLCFQARFRFEQPETEKNQSPLSESVFDLRKREKIVGCRLIRKYIKLKWSVSVFDKYGLHRRVKGSLKRQKGFIGQRRRPS